MDRRRQRRGKIQQPVRLADAIIAYAIHLPQHAHGHRDIAAETDKHDARQAGMQLLSFCRRDGFVDDTADEVPPVD